MTVLLLSALQRFERDYAVSGAAFGEGAPGGAWAETRGCLGHTHGESAREPRIRWVVGFDGPDGPDLPGPAREDPNAVTPPSRGRGRPSRCGPRSCATNRAEAAGSHR